MDDQLRMKVLRNFAAGATATTIGHSLRLKADEVDEVLAEFGHRRDLASAEARRLRTAGMPDPVVAARDDDLLLAPQVEVSAAGAPLPALPHALPRPMSPMPAASIGSLLDDATKAGGRLAATARKVRALVEQLRQDVDEHREVLEAQRRVEEARAALEAAQSRLKALKAGESPVVQVTTLAPGPRLLRQWAKANGVECPDYGRVPQAVVDAWEAAHQGVAA